MEDIFTYIENCAEREYLLRLSMVEIYNEHLQDLLSNNAKPIHIQENKVCAYDKKGKIEIEGLSENICTSIDQITAFLNTAQLNKHVGVTDMNAKSSRSHTMYDLSQNATYN